METKSNIITWDWKGQIDIYELNAALTYCGFKGEASLINTESDQMGIVITDSKVTEDWVVLEGEI